MSTEVYDWTSFTKRININAPIEKVYEKWATINGMESWFLRMCAYKKSDTEWYSAFDTVEAGTTFSWYWHGWSDDVVEKGKIIEANGKDFLKFTFGQEGAENMICTIRIYIEENETICEILQENTPVDEKGKTHYHIGCSIGWTFYLANLKSILEGGIDLRNKNIEIKKVINS